MLLPPDAVYVLRLPVNDGGTNVGEGPAVAVGPGVLVGPGPLVGVVGTEHVVGGGKAERSRMATVPPE